MKRLSLLLLLVPGLASAAISWNGNTTTCTSTTTTCTVSALPTGVVAGDVVIAVSIARNVSNAVSTSTTGWNSKHEAATTNVRYGLWYMRYTGSESAPSFSRSSAGSLTRWIVVVFAASGAIASGDPLDVLGTPVQTSSSPITIAAQTTNYDNSWVFAYVGGAIGTSSAPACSSESGATPTEITDANAGTSTNRIGVCILRADSAQASAGSTGTTSVTVTPTTSSYWVTVHGALREALPVTGGMSGFFP